MEIPVTIRRAGIKDADELLQLSRNTFFEAFAHLNEPQNMAAYASLQFTREGILKQLNNPDSAFYFAIVNKQTAGYLKLNTRESQTDLKDRQGLEIERIYVSGTFQGNQIGTRMISFAIKQAKRLKLDMIWLGVWQHNISAGKFYENLGFKISGSHEFMLGEDRQVELLMRRELSKA